MGNLLLQTPIPIGRFQPYFTIGGGLYRERVDAIDRQETSFGSNIGGGAKITLTGPLRVRVDYRLFNLRGDPLHRPSTGSTADSTSHFSESPAFGLNSLRFLRASAQRT